MKVYVLSPWLLFSALLVACSSGGNAPQDGGDGDAGTPILACDPTMDWKPRDWSTGANVYVDATADAASADGTQAHPYPDLQQAIDAAPDAATLHLAAGAYDATPSDYTDPTCGNCSPDKQHTVSATRGFVITKPIALVGAGQATTTLRTHAGYGVFIEDACDVLLKDLAITGGARDASGDASDGAVFVRRSRATVQAVTIRENNLLLPGNSYPGIIGIVLRDASDVLVMGATITQNSWDGISVYADGKLRVYGTTISKGNGVGIGATWDGTALAINNDISSYWKGIGAFVRAKVEARNNTVHENLGWGLWAAQNGQLTAVNNTVAYNDQLGVYLADVGTSGKFVNNVVAFNGLDRFGAYPPDTFGEAGIRGPAAANSPFVPAYNALFGNMQTDWVAADGTTPIASTDWGTGIVTSDPMLISEGNLSPSAGSPLLHTGDPTILDPDGTRSQIGATGGPDVGRTGP